MTNGRETEIAYMLYRLLDGDTVDNAYEILEHYGYVDENHEWKYDE